MNITAMIRVGKSAPRRRPMGEMPFSKCLFRMLWPAGLGALAITVRPPPVTAPATTAYSNPRASARAAPVLETQLSATRISGLKAGTCEARNVIAALSLNAVKTVAPMNNGTSASELRTGEIHQPCKPPCVTSPARKKPTSSGDFS